MPVDQRLELHQLLPALVEGRLITPEIAQRLSALPASNTLHPLESIAAQGLCLETLTEWLAQRAGQPYLRIDPLKIDVATVVPLMSHAFAQRHAILAVAVDAQTVTVASAQPHVTSWEAGLSQVLKRSIKRVVANPQDITRCIGEFYRLAKSVSGADQKVVAAGNVDLLNLGAREQEPDANDAHIVNIVDWLLQYAFAQRASDIHIEPCREQGRVRFRIDGLLHDVYQFPPQVTMAVVSRLKSLGRMNVAEKRRPQDGRVKTKSPTGAEVELRLSTLPTAFGEKLVLHLHLVERGLDHLDRVFHGAQVDLPGRQLPECGVERAGLARTGRAGHQDDAVSLARHGLPASLVIRRQAKLVKALEQHLRVENPQHQLLTKCRCSTTST
jgi:general secretion pathway protein E